MSEWTEGPRVDFQKLKETIYALDERIGVLEELTHRYDDTKHALQDVYDTLQHHREWLTAHDDRLQELFDKHAGVLEELEEIEPSIEYKRLDMKLKVCGEKSDTLDQHTCMNPSLHEDPHECECGYTWGGVIHREERTATVIITEKEYREINNLGEAVETLRRKLDPYGKREHMRIGAWEPTFTTVDGIMCPAWILKGAILTERS